MKSGYHSSIEFIQDDFLGMKINYPVHLNQEMKRHFDSKESLKGI